MRIAATGFVEAGSGSIAGAGALLLKGLLAAGCRVRFFSKASFVDPRPAVPPGGAFEFFDTDNRAADRLRAALAGVPVAGDLARLLDVSTYNRLLLQELRHQRHWADVVLWMGDYARGAVSGIPSVSFAQGPPGTDARSVITRFHEVRRMAGLPAALRWRILAGLRLSRAGLPDFGASNHIIVGSKQSRETLRRLFGVPGGKTSAIPYPLDLDRFRPATSHDRNGPLRCLWLGRIVPRKRLDLFLEGAALAERQGCDLTVTIAGRIGFIQGYEKLIGSFPGRLRWEKEISRDKVPGLLAAHDLLVQPSEEEDFGSSVAEAQACGLPVIVGRTSGNADYLCARDRQLSGDDPEILAGHFVDFARRKSAGCLGDPMDSRRHAERVYDPARVAGLVLDILSTAARQP